MIEEEKKAIEILKEITTDDLLNCWEGGEKEYNAIQTTLNLIQSQQKEIEKKDEIINILFDERNYIINNLETDLNRKGIYSEAKGQISQILEYYKNNDKYFEKKVEDINDK